jgi:hypothetical protein
MNAMPCHDQKCKVQLLISFWRIPGESAIVVCSCFRFGMEVMQSMTIMVVESKRKIVCSHPSIQYMYVRASLTQSQKKNFRGPKNFL